MSLELTSLIKSVQTLERSLFASQPQKMAVMDEETKEVVRAGVIQHFEVTYELCWKFIKRWLELNRNSVEVDGVTRRELFRLAAEHRLIESVDEWMRYHDARNSTSHIYEFETAVEVFDIAPTFCSAAKLLVTLLKARND